MEHFDTASKLTVATFNLENWDEDAETGGKEDEGPSLKRRIEFTRPQLLRLEADILCLQEVNAQGEAAGRDLSALDELLEDTPYADYERATTKVQDEDYPYAERNLIILSRYPVLASDQYRNDYAPALAYRVVTAEPRADEAKPVGWERPIQHVQLELPTREGEGDGGEEPETAGSAPDILHVINLHLKSKLPTTIEGQKEDRYTWTTASGWAEGYFLSSMKRVGQALEVRMLIDSILDEVDEEQDARILVCGDFNADLEAVPVKAIRGEVEEHGNGDLANRVMLPCENSIPDSTRYSLIYQGEGEMIDHILMSRGLLSHYRGAEVHNEVLHDESVAYSTDKLYPESDHAPVLARFEI